MSPVRLLCSVPRTGQACRALATAALLGFSCPAVVNAADVDIAPIPLIASVDTVYPLLVLTPSVEWPTINSVANVEPDDPPYSPQKTYVGYFDADKCYDYQYDDDEESRHFDPVRTPSGRDCENTHWSGNFLNWVATQTIDPFRLALTGGYRVKDTREETWLEKARHDGRDGTNIYPDRNLSGTDLITQSTPLSGDDARFRIQGLDHKMRFRIDGDNTGLDLTPYDPAAETSDDRAYELSVRVKVCDPEAGLEDFCVPYGDHWKPEGLLQEYAQGMQVAVFGYLNDHDELRDGGVMRARKKWVGPQRLSDGEWEGNPAREWDPATGILERNPDAGDAAAGSADIQDSGVINYINR
ncbi:MAG: hypothetical protein ACLFTM_09715, partial [Ectothiorhodospira sp.]